MIQDDTPSKCGITLAEGVTPEIPLRDKLPLIILNLVLQTGYLFPRTAKEYNPVNLLFIAKSGIGKSRLLLSTRPLRFVYFCEDMTPKYLVDFLKKVKRGTKKFLVIPDYNSIIHAHGRKTQSTMQSILREGMSDGITNLDDFGLEFHSKIPVKFGVVSAITVDSYSEFKESWKKTGFLNRFLPYSFQHNQATEEEILNTIYDKKPERFIFPNFTIKEKFDHPKMDSKLVKLLEPEAKRLSEVVKATPYRDAIRLTDLLECFLIITNTPKLTIDDVLKFRALLSYVNYDFKEV